MYEILKVYENKTDRVEVRLSKIDSGYSIATWDLDTGFAFPVLRIYPYALDDALEKATEYFDKYVEKKKISLTL